MAPRLAVAIAAVCVAIGLNDPATGRAAAASLGRAHLGVAVAAPAPPALGEADQATYAWRRCAFYTPLVSADGASHLWRLDDSSTSTGAADVLGSAPGTYLGSHATAASAPLAGQGSWGAAFDGSSSEVLLAGAADEPGTDAYTFELWARPERVDSSYRFLISREGTVGGQRAGTGVWLSKSGLGFERWSGGASSSIDYATGLALDRWSYVVASYDGTTMRLYVNGVQVGSRATSAPLGALPGPSVVGAGAGTGFFAGDLADVALYPLALARAHVAAHYADATHTPCTAIPGATGTTYTPVLGDLGDALTATATATGAVHSASTEGQSEGPVDDGHGNLALATIEGPTEAETLSGTVTVSAALHGLPADRIEFEVDGQYRYSKVAEAPYQYTWYTRAESNGPHTVGVELWGPGASTPTVAQVTVNVHNPTVYPTPLLFGEE
ncbi:MAG TPA: LamG-like jellyroll fold domain-containing protein, partial [Solirubrobacteraceae bacterium]|nr:LamG-like jellyroll fold domain-containing protein [Solirubrobacteraceae bacterium]